jgi:hypothetical protein
LSQGGNVTDYMKNKQDEKYRKIMGTILMANYGDFKLDSKEYVRVNETWMKLAAKNPKSPSYPTFTLGFGTGIQYHGINSYDCIKSMAYGIRNVLILCKLGFLNAYVVIDVDDETKSKFHL